METSAVGLPASPPPPPHRSKNAASAPAGSRLGYTEVGIGGAPPPYGMAEALAARQAEQRGAGRLGSLIAGRLGCGRLPPNETATHNCKKKL